MKHETFNPWKVQVHMGEEETGEFEEKGLKGIGNSN